jgi:hypothetical protein
MSENIIKDREYRNGILRRVHHIVTNESELRLNTYYNWSDAEKAAPLDEAITHLKQLRDFYDQRQRGAISLGS